MNVKSIFKNKSFRYGSLSVVLTALIVALVIVLNVVFTLLASHFNLYKDMTEEQLYTVSDASFELLDEVFKPDEKTGKPLFEGKMSIIFLQDADKIKSATSDEGKDLEKIRKLAESYERAYSDHIEIKYVDMNANPGQLSAYTSKGTTLTSQTVVFDSNVGPYRAVYYKNFFYYGDSGSSRPTAFYGEHRITSSILSVCNKQFIAYNTVGHGEDSLSPAFRMLLESAGYTIKDVNLQEMSFEQLRDGVRADKPRLVIVNNPQNEFVTTSNQSQLNELEKLMRILSGEFLEGTVNDFTSLLLIADPLKKSANRNLNSILEEWGLRVFSAAGDMVGEAAQNAISVDGTAFLATYSSDEVLSGLTSKLQAGGNHRVALNGAGYVTTRRTDESALSVRAGSVLETSDKKSVFAVSQRENIVDQAILKYNYAIVIPDASLVSDEYLTSASFANEELMTNVIRMTTIDNDATPKIVSVDSYKDYIVESNVTAVTVGEKQAFLVFMAAILPLTMLTVGIVVYVRRRNRV